MSEDSDVEKTEEPTPRKKEKAREEGQIPRSKELASLLILVTGWGVFFIMGGELANKMAFMIKYGLNFDRSLTLDSTSMLRQLKILLELGFSSFLVILFSLWLIGLCAPMVPGGVHFGGKIIKFEAKKLNPISGIKRMFSMQMFSELFKSLLKVILVSIAGFLYIKSNINEFIQLSSSSLDYTLMSFQRLILGSLLVVLLALIPMTAYDLFYQIFSNLKKLRMSRQEIRDEYKQSEGDPHVKNKIRQLQRAAASKRMMSDVPEADVIVNNPTHFSVALRYKEGKNSAPIVVAKGKGEIALRIRDIAIAHSRPMLEAPPLARALYHHCEIGQPIPGELYSAVAEVLAWVYSLKRWQQAGGQPPKEPKNLPVPKKLDMNKEIVEE
jgi:flagellar biosynthetic protein FlhB